MKPTCLAIFLIALVSAEEFYYTEDGHEYLCGNCKDYTACDSSNGKCSQGCATGWFTDASMEQNADCQQPKCDDVTCGGESICVAENQCACAKNYAKSEDGGCYSMRVDGLKGAFMAMLVLVCAISFCGLTQQHFEKKKLKAGVKSE